MGIKCYIVKIKIEAHSAFIFIIICRAATLRHMQLEGPHSLTGAGGGAFFLELISDFS